MNYNVELYQENGMYCAYIAGDNDSGYKIVAETVEERAEEIKNFFLDIV